MTRVNNVFHNRNFRLVFFGALVSELGALLYSFAVSFYILEISGSNAFLQGLYLALCGVALLVFTPVGGVLGDRFNKAAIMYLCDYLKGGIIILATALMLLLPSPGAQLTILFILGILSNMVSGIFAPASGALFPHILEEEQLQQANSYCSMKSSLESIAGVILAGILYAALPIHILFFIVGACFIASGISETQIRYEYKKPETHLTPKLAMRDMADGLGYLRTKRAILSLLGAILFINFFFTPVTGNFLPFFVKTDLAGAPSYLFDRFLTPELWSSVYGVFCGLGALLGAAVLSSRRQAEKCGFRTAVRLGIIALIMLGLTAAYWLLVDSGDSLNAFLCVFTASGFVMGILISLVNIPLNTLIMRVVDRDKLSKVNSIISIGSQGMIPLASVLAGAILETLGSTPLLAFCTLGFTATALRLLFNRRIRDL